MGKRILHIVDHTSDHKTTGYTVRSNYILKTQVRLGMTPVVCSISPLTGKGAGGRVDGVEYFYPNGPQFSFARMLPFVREWKKEIVSLCGQLEVDLIHAHSPFHCALPAVHAARATGLPCVNEIRGLWHESVKVENDSGAKKIGFFLRGRAESYAARHADRIIVISEGLRRHVSRLFSIDEQKISIIPNGVEFNRFKDFGGSSRPENLPDDGSVLLGYIGTIRRLEGLHIAIEAMSRADELGVKVHLVIIGQGAERDTLEAQARTLGVTDRVSFLGQVPQQDVEGYYEHIDVLLFPRSKSTVTDIVTPLKPLEAEAMGKVLLASDVKGLKELIPSDEFLFRADDIDDFLVKLKTMVNDLDGFRSMTGKNRDFAESRDWSTVCEGYGAIYDSLF
jgi:glycogen(starch) synthase